MLTIQNLSLEYYRRGRTIHALRDVSLAIAPGETVGLVGESGSGKSSIALAILRLIRAQEGRITSGKIVFDSRDLLSLNDSELRGVRGRQIGIVFQDPFTSLNPVLRIETQLIEAFDAHKMPCDRAKLLAALDSVQLEPERTLRSYPHQLSGGQRQRVAIAMAIILNPRLLLADEPTTALDVLVQKEILELLFTLQRDRSMALLLITHDLPLVASRTDRLLVMREGRLVESGATRALLQSPDASYTGQLVEACRKLRKTG